MKHGGPSFKLKQQSYWVLAGNPNVGKSVLFHQLTGRYVQVSNFPGTTLEIEQGFSQTNRLIDTPGVYGLSSFNDEERITRDYVLYARGVINVVHALHLSRDLFLTQQLIDTGIPIIVVINQMAEACSHGLCIDLDKLSEKLGVPVIEVEAVHADAADRIWAVWDKAAIGRATPQAAHLLASSEELRGTQGERLLVLEGDAIVAERLRVPPQAYMERLYVARRRRVDDVYGSCTYWRQHRASIGARLGRALLRPLFGIPLLLAVLALIMKGIGDVVAGDVVAFTEQTVMQGYYEPLMIQLVTGVLGLSSSEGVGALLVGQFGLLTMTVTYVFGLMLPLVFSFYLCLSLLEDSGYLPRLAVWTDRLLQSIGLNGRAIIPLILGFGCVTMATVTTRLLSGEKEKKLTVALLALVIPCSAQLAVMASLFPRMGLHYSLLYFFVILLVLLLTGTVLNRFLKGEAPFFLMDIPAMRWPRFQHVWKKTTVKTIHFIQEALPLFALGALILGIMEQCGLLQLLAKALSPVMVGWLGLPKEASQAFIMGFVRRDFGAAGLLNLPLTAEQMVTALITMTLFVPCIASLLVLWKERGSSETILLWVVSLTTGFLAGGTIHFLLWLFAGHTPAGQTRGALAVLFSFFFATQLLLHVSNKKADRPC